MLYKFKSSEASDVLMLGPHGNRLLEIIGKTPGPTGIILPEQMPAAIAALRAAIADENQAAANASASEDDEEKDEGRNEKEEGTPRRDPTSLRQRAAPLLDMLSRSHAAGVQIVWGV